MSFKDIIGQDKSISFLQRAINSRELPPAYLFLGIDGIGKRLTALSLAKAINCPENTTDSCGECFSCQKIENFNHPDVIWVGLLENSSFIKIEQIRQLQHQLSLKPFEAKRKTAVILEADFLNNESSNALLKTLEEPPGESLVILTASNASRIFSTVKSRCQILKFFPLKTENIKQVLVKKHNLPEEEANILSRMSQGSPGGALRLKGQDILQKREELINNLIYENNNFWQDLYARDTFKADFLETLDILAMWYRDLLVFKIGARESELVNLDKKDLLSLFAQDYTLEAADRVITLIFQLKRETEQNLNPKLLCQRLLLEIEGAKV